jgi:hypothetical protein
MTTFEWVMSILVVVLVVWLATAALLLSLGRVKPGKWWGYSAPAMSLIALGIVVHGVGDVPMLRSQFGTLAARIIGTAGWAMFIAGLLVNNSARRRILNGAREDPPTSLNL